MAKSTSISISSSSDSVTVLRVVSIIFAIAIIVLHATALSYLNKLEHIKCPCANHPYRPYLKSYMIVAIILLAINMFVPFLELNETSSALIGIFVVIWAFATVAFFIMALQYVRYLVKEKCGCSEDIRREVLYIWSVLELTLLAILILLPLFIFLILGVVSIVYNAISSSASESSKTGKDFASRVMDSVSEVPGHVVKSLTDPSKSIKNASNKLTEQLKKVSDKISIKVK